MSAYFVTDFLLVKEPDAIIELNAPSVDNLAGMSQGEAADASISAFEAVFDAGPNIELDHHIVYHARTSLPLLIGNFD